MAELKELSALGEPYRRFLPLLYPAVMDLAASLTSVLGLKDWPAGSQANLLQAMLYRWQMFSAVMEAGARFGLGLEVLEAAGDPVPGMTAMAEEAMKRFSTTPAGPGTLLAEAQKAADDAGYTGRPGKKGG